MKNYH